MKLSELKDALDKMQSVAPDSDPELIFQIDDTTLELTDIRREGEIPGLSFKRGELAVMQDPVYDNEIYFYFSE